MFCRVGQKPSVWVVVELLPTSLVPMGRREMVFNVEVGEQSENNRMQREELQLKEEE